MGNANHTKDTPAAREAGTLAALARLLARAAAREWLAAQPSENAAIEPGDRR